MSQDNKTAHAIGYTVRTLLGDDTKSYDCNSCPHSSTGVDHARAHQAIHAAGPELLAAAKAAETGLYTGRGSVPFIISMLHDAIAKAEPQAGKL